MSSNKWLITGNSNDAYSIEGFENTTISHCLNCLQKREVIVVDTETRPKEQYMAVTKAGLDCHLNEVVMMQIGDEEDQFIIDTRLVDVSPLQPILENEEVLKVGQNLKFDYKTILSNFGIRVTNIADTMIQEHVINTGKIGKRASLEVLAKKYLDFEFAKTNQLSLFEEPKEVILTKSVRNEFKNIGNTPFTKTQALYGAYDVILPLGIWRKQREILSELNLTSCADMENTFVSVMGELEYNGFYLDVPKWTELYQKRLKEYRDARQVLVDYIFDHQVEELYRWTKSLFEEEKVLSINFSSSQQVVELLNALGIDTKIVDKEKSKKKGYDVFKDSIEERVLKKYKKRFPIVPIYLEFKRLEKSVTTYGEDFLKYVNPETGRVHCSFRQILRTGRMASSSPNLQNIPNGKKLSGYRECFTNSNSNTKLIVADYSNQEGRILADRSGDANMIDFFLNGDGDLHS